MTDMEKYTELLKEIGELLSQKSARIICQDIRINQLEEALKAAEAELEEARIALNETAKKEERKDW